MKSTEIKYIELIRDLTYKKDFRQAVLDYRIKLGIPRNGFISDKQEMAFVNEGKIDLLDKSAKSQNKLTRRYKHDKPFLEKILQWKDIFDEGAEMLGILKRYQIPPRAAYMLYYFILYTPQYLKDIEQKLYNEGELRDYGCSLHCMWPYWPKGPFKKVDLPDTDNDLAAVVCIYPEAQRSDVLRLINENWEDGIKLAQRAQAKKSNIRIDNVRTKLFREKYDKIYRLHKMGLPAWKIAARLNMDNEGSWEYVRKAISIARKREK